MSHLYQRIPARCVGFVASQNLECVAAPILPDMQQREIFSAPHTATPQSGETNFPPIFYHEQQAHTSKQILNNQ